MLRVVYFPLKCVSGLCILALILSELAKVLSPTLWVWPAFVGLAYPLILVVNVLFVIFWLFAKQRFFLYPLLGVILSFFSIRNTIGVAGQRSTPIVGTTFSMLSYNTRMNGQYMKPTAKTKNETLAYIAEQDADVVCIQEFGVGGWKERLTIEDVYEMMKRYPYRHVSYAVESKYHSVGVATFSKYPIVKRKRLDIGVTGNSAIYTDVRIKGDTVRVFNLHLESNRLTQRDMSLTRETDLQVYAGGLSSKLSVAYEKRAHQAQCVAKAIDETRHKVVVCGDFNDVPISYTYHTVRGNLADSFLENGIGIGATFHQLLMGVRIDYVLHDSELYASEFEVGKVKYSDHYPLKCKMTIQ